MGWAPQMLRQLALVRMLIVLKRQGNERVLSHLALQQQCALPCIPVPRFGRHAAASYKKDK
jgi:hypothetical protein